MRTGRDVTSYFRSTFYIRTTSESEVGGDRDDGREVRFKGSDSRFRVRVQGLEFQVRVRV